MRNFACMVVNSITGYNYNFLFNCMLVGQTSESIPNLTDIAINCGCAYSQACRMTHNVHAIYHSFIRLDPFTRVSQK